MKKNDSLLQICGKCAPLLAERGAAVKLISLVPVMEATGENARGVEAGISHVLRGLSCFVIFDL